MKAVHFVATALVGVVMFLAGLLVRPLLVPQERQETAAEPNVVVEVQQRELSAQELAARGYLSVDTLQVRIDDGEIQWYDGTVWHSVDTVEKMEKEDKFYAAQDSFRQFEEQLKQQLEAGRAEQESANERGETLLVGQKETPKPVETPRPTKPAVTAPVTEQVPVPDPAVPTESAGDDSGNSGGGDGGNSGGGNPGGGDGGNSGGGNPGGGDGGNGGDNNPGNDDGGNTRPGSDTGNDDPGGDTGDGENMEWSDDYL